MLAATREATRIFFFFARAAALGPWWRPPLRRDACGGRRKRIGSGVTRAQRGVQRVAPGAVRSRWQRVRSLNLLY